MTEANYRLITRSDFDGLVCAILLKELGLVREILFVHPKDMQDGQVPVTGQDITANLPYVPGVHLAFDHHVSEEVRNKEKKDNYISDPNADSTARMIYNYYGGKSRFVGIPDELLTAVDQADSGNYQLDDILAAKDWTLLNFIMDPRTGLGRFREFAIPNKQLMMDMIEYCRHYPVEKILQMPDVKERVDLYQEHYLLAKQQLQRRTKMIGDIALIDFTEEPQIYACNRFLVYALFPKCTISIHRLQTPTKDKIVFAVGKSIINRASKASIGEILLEYGGGGHEAAGTCQIEMARAEQVLQEIIAKINAAGTHSHPLGNFLAKLKTRMAVKRQG